MCGCELQIVFVNVCVPDRVSKRERKRERVCVCVCVCVCERQEKRECVCVCVCSTALVHLNQLTAREIFLIRIMLQHQN